MVCNTYFDADDHYMYTGYHAINGELYYFNADGSCWGKCGPQSVGIRQKESGTL